MSPSATSASWSAWLTADPRRTDVAVALATVIVALVLLAGGPVEHEIGWPEAAAGIATFVLVVPRRRWPLPLLTIALAWTAVHSVVWERPSLVIAAVLVLLSTACVRLERRRAVALGIGVMAVLYANALVINDDVRPGDGRLLLAPVGSLAAVGIGDAIRSWHRYRASADAQVRSAVLASEAQARRQVTEERLAIARELHDLLGHNLSVMNVQTGAALHLLRTDPDRAEEALTAARDAGRSVLDELRELLAVLRDRTGDDDAPRAALPTVEDLPRLVETLRAAGLEITTTETGRARHLAPAVSVAAYRIAQEALTNAAKHGAGRAVLDTEWDDEVVTITVENPVPSPTAATTVRPGGQGLVGMRERATAHGGTLDVGPTGSGFVVRARLPVARAGADGGSGGSGGSPAR